MLQDSFSGGVYDYYELLGLGEGYGISKFKIIKKSWLANKKIRSLGISDEGIIILSIKRKIDKKDIVMGVPPADTVIKAGDELVCYGNSDDLKNLSERLKGRKGNEEHRRMADINKIQTEKVSDIVESKY